MTTAVRRGLNTTECPHCRSHCRSVKSRQMARTYREVTYVCTNSACGYVFVASITPVRTLEPSDTPDPEVHIPLTTQRSAQ